MLKRTKYFFSILLSVILILVCFCSCSFAKNDQNYVTARYNELISKSEDAVCWVTNTNKNFYIEYNNKIKNKWSYHINIAPYYYSPFLSQNYMYYIGGIQDDFTHNVYIARINYTKENPKVEQLTENYNEIFSYTVYKNMIFFTADRNGETNICTFCRWVEFGLSLLIKRFHLIYHTAMIMYIIIFCYQIYRTITNSKHQFVFALLAHYYRHKVVSAN